MSESWKPEDLTEHISRSLGIPKERLKPPKRPVKVGDTILIIEEGETCELHLEEDQGGRGAGPIG
jgi:hypothetical protein